MTTSNSIIGSCGEHYVAAYLAGHGLIVALPRAGVPGSDLFVGSVSGGNPLRVQVKTGTRSLGNTKWGKIYQWPTSCSIIDSHHVRLWYAYVWLNGWPAKNGQPEVFFIPSLDVAACMKKERDENKDRPTWRPFFWMDYDDAQQHRDNAGVKSLIEATTANDPAVLATAAGT